MQLDDADAGDTAKEKDARSPCGMTRDDDSDRQRQCEKDEDDAVAAPTFIGGATADDADALLGATTPPPLPAGAGVAVAPAALAEAADGDDGHLVERGADARKVTRWDWDAVAADTSGATALLLLALRSFGAGCGGRGFLVRPGRRKQVHLTTPLTGGSVAPLAILGRSGVGGGGRGLLVCRGSDWGGARGTFSLAEAMGASQGGLNR
jgi:hypothetical protein